MKYFAVVAGTALMLAAGLSPAMADPTAHVTALAPPALAVSQGSGCEKPASVDAAFFEMPAIAEAQGIGGIVQVRIDLTSSGALASEALYSSSGNPWLDAAALTSAKLSRFAPETAGCRHVGGSYLYDVEF